jgi:hypothetical protein
MRAPDGYAHLRLTWFGPLKSRVSRLVHPPNISPSRYSIRSKTRNGASSLKERLRD